MHKDKNTNKCRIACARVCTLNLSRSTLICLAYGDITPTLPTKPCSSPDPGDPKPPNHRFRVRYKFTASCASGALLREPPPSLFCRPEVRSKNTKGWKIGCCDGNSVAVREM